MLKATAAGMDDWKAHIKFMQYNKEHPDPHAADRQTSWMKQYRAAPRTSKPSRRRLRTSRHPTADRGRGKRLVPASNQVGH